MITNECHNINELVRICSTGNRNVHYTLDYIDIIVFDVHTESEEKETQQSIESITAVSTTVTSQQDLTDQVIPMQKSVMAAIGVDVSRKFNLF